MRGLAPDEAANLTAYVSGIPVTEASWTLAQVNRLLFLREPRAELLRLRRAALRERNVDMSLDALDAVPVRFAVADKENLRVHGQKRMVKNTGFSCALAART